MRIADSSLRADICTHVMNDRSFSLTLRRSVESAKAGQADGNLTSMFKLYGSEQNKKKSELTARVLGTQFLGWEGDGFGDRELGATRAWLRTKANSIEGGTSEVQLNVIAKRVLGLPD